MLTLADCIALCDLSREEVEALAQHEHIPELAAAELGNYLVRTPSGELRLKDMLLHDIAAAARRGDSERAAALKLVIRDFISRHPCCEARHHPRPS